MHVRSADCARFDCEWVWVSADVIVGGDGGAAVVAERVALPAVNNLVERHLWSGSGSGIGLGLRLR